MIRTIFDGVQKNGEEWITSSLHSTAGSKSWKNALGVACCKNVGQQPCKRMFASNPIRARRRGSSELHRLNRCTRRAWMKNTEFLVNHLFTETILSLIVSFAKFMFWQLQSWHHGIVSFSRILHNKMQQIAQSVAPFSPTPAAQGSYCLLLQELGPSNPYLPLPRFQLC